MPTLLSDRIGTIPVERIRRERSIRAPRCGFTDAELIWPDGCATLDEVAAIDV